MTSYESGFGYSLNNNLRYWLSVEGIQKFKSKINTHFTNKITIEEDDHFRKFIINTFTINTMESDEQRLEDAAYKYAQILKNAHNMPTQQKLWSKPSAGLSHSSDRVKGELEFNIGNSPFFNTTMKELYD